MNLGIIGSNEPQGTSPEQQPIDSLAVFVGIRDTKS